MKKLLRILAPVLLLAGAVLGGAAAGELLRRPAPEADAGAEAAHGEAAHAAAAAGGHGGGAAPANLAWMKFPQQFFVPIVRGGELRSVMILALSLEMPAASEETILRQEHRLRDALLRRLLIHANTGGFDGNFTAEAHLALLREILLAEARTIAGPEISAVLIGDIARQER